VRGRQRRMKVPWKLNIETKIKKLPLGKGETADAQRLKLAIVSNIGFKPMTREDRKRLAEHLYGEREWTIERIAEALNVVHSTIVKDLKGFVPPKQTFRPKGGRPKGSGGRGNAIEPKVDKARNRQPDSRTRDLEATIADLR